MSGAAITGWALRTPVGHETEEVLSRLIKGEHGFSLEGKRLEAPVCVMPLRSSHGRFLPRMAALGTEVALEAVHHARATAGLRTGVFAGVGGLHAYWEETRDALAGQRPGVAPWPGGLGRLHPFWLLRRLSNNAHALFAAEAGITGEGMTFGGRNAGGQALASATRSLLAGSVDVAVVMAYDSLREPENALELTARGVTATGAIADLRGPYDESACGFVPGEAAAAVVLERSEDSDDRALALIEAAVGADGSCTEPAPATVARVARRVSRCDLLVDGAGLANRAFDAGEREALGAVLDRRAWLMSTASSFGQVGAPTALLQAILLAATLRRGVVPPIAALSNPVSGPLVPDRRPRSTAARSALGVGVGAPGLSHAVRVALP